jgi:hypothetical protein
MHKLARKIVEGLMHRALEDGIKLPERFGLSALSRSPSLFGKAKSIMHETTSPDITKQRPMYYGLDSTCLSLTPSL